MANPETTTITTADALLAMGHSSWQKGGHDRIYICGLGDILSRRTQFSATVCREADRWKVFFDVANRRWGGMGDWNDRMWVAIREAVKAEVAEYRDSHSTIETRCARCGIAINPHISSYAAGVGACCATCYDIAEEGN